MFNFNWWRNEDNRNGATAIVNALKVVVPALIVAAMAVAAWFGFGQTEGSGTPETPPVECNSTLTQTGDGNLIQNCGGGTVQVDGGSHQDRIQCNSEFKQDGEGNLIQICGDGTVIIGLTQEKFFAELERREAEIRADLTRASSAEKQVLELQLEKVQQQKANLASAYQQAVADLDALRTRLEEFEGQVPRAQLEAAQHALFEGDRSKADALLAGVEAQLQDEVALAARAAFDRGVIADQDVRWNDAAAHFARAANLHESFNILRMAARFAGRTGDYREALRYSEKLADLARESGSDKERASALNSLALRLKDMGRFAEAEKLHREGLAISAEIYGTGHRVYATDLNNLAWVVHSQGRYAEAEDLFRQVLEVDATTIGTDHTHYAAALSNLALTLQARSRFAEAEDLYRQALEIDAAAIGQDHPDYATDLNNLAHVVAAQDRLAEAETLFRDAVKVTAAALGTGHPSYLLRVTNLARVVQAQGRYPEAEAHLRDALETAGQIHGTETSRYAFQLGLLATAVAEQGRTDEARRQLEQALSLVRENLPPGHKTIARIEKQIADLPEP